MASFTNAFNLFSGAGTILLQCAVFFIAAVFIFARFGKNFRLAASAGNILKWIGERGVLFGFIVASVSLIGSLIYSEIIGFPPCELCWFQRIFLYPQALILGLALWRKTRDAGIYCLWLSATGFLVAAYHYYGQMFDPLSLPCPASGAGSCAVRFFVEFGYITIPMMSLSVFALLILLMLPTNFYGKNRH